MISYEIILQRIYTSVVFHETNLRIKPCGIENEWDKLTRLDIQDFYQTSPFGIITSEKAYG